MRTARLLGEGRSFYHCISRVVDRRMIFEAKDKGIFRKMLRDLEAFMGVRVVTYCFMTNHFHLLLEIPDGEELAPLSEEAFLEILPRISDPTAARSVKEELGRAHAAGNEEAVAAVLARFERRRGSLSQFMKELKMRMTRYMNKRLNRTGTLWESRYKSVLVAADGGCVYRFESGAGRNCGSTGRLFLVRLLRSDLGNAGREACASGAWGGFVRIA